MFSKFTTWLKTLSSSIPSPHKSQKSSTMSLQISPVTKEELRDVVDMLFKAYDSSSAFVNAVYPHKLTPSGVEGLDMVVARLQYLRDIDPSTQWIKVTDTSTGEIISASQWNVYDDQKPPEMMLDGPPGAWKDETEKKYAIEMFKNFIASRYGRYREVEAPIVCLNIMGTAKKHQHRGAASMQVAEYNRKADELNALITTESTKAALKLYEKHGYVFQKDISVEAISEEFAGRPKEALYFMERPRSK